jgi:hypothetical protein
MTNMIRLAGLASLALAFCGAARAEPLNCSFIAGVPFTISAPGNYCLDGNFTASGVAIDIVADDVVLDLNGHALDGVSGSGIGVRASDRKNITVRNGTVRNFYQGLSLGGSASEGLIVERMRAAGNGFVGIDVQGRGSVVRNNVLIGNANSPSPGPRWSISVVGAGSHVHDNEVVDTGLGVSGSEVDGIRIAFAPRTTVERNVVANASASSSFSRGIFYLNSAGSTAIANRVYGFVFGIALESGCLYKDNTVNGATTPFIGGTSAGNTNFSF